MKELKYELGDIVYLNIIAPHHGNCVGQVLKYDEERKKYIVLFFIDIFDPNIGYSWSYLKEEELSFYQSKSFKKNQIFYPENTPLPIKKYYNFDIEYYDMMRKYHNHQISYEELEKYIKDFYNSSVTARSDISRCPYND